MRGALRLNMKSRIRNGFSVLMIFQFAHRAMLILGRTGLIDTAKVHRAARNFVIAESESATFHCAHESTVTRRRQMPFRQTFSTFAFAYQECNLFPPIIITCLFLINDMRCEVHCRAHSAESKKRERQTHAKK